MTGAEFEALLSDASTCLLTEDFDLWAGRVVLPFTMVTLAGPVVAYTLAELRANFDLYIMACKNMNLDVIFRTPTSCEICEDGSVIATYKTELLSHGQRMVEPFTSSATVVRQDGVWRMTAIIGARGHKAATSQMPDKPKVSIAELSDPSAKRINDTILELTGTAIIAHDFEKFATAFSLPHTVTTFDAKRTLTTKAEMAFIFNQNCAYFNELQVTDIVRESSSASFDGPDIIKAMHVTHLMSGNRRVKDPYPAFSLLTFTDDVWRVSKSDYAVGADNGLTIAINKLPGVAPFSNTDAA